METHVVVRPVQLLDTPGGAVLPFAPLPRFTQVTGSVVDEDDGAYLETSAGYLPLAGADGSQLLARDKSAEDAHDLTGPMLRTTAARRAQGARLHDEYGDPYPVCQLTTRLIGDRVGVGLQILFATVKWYCGVVALMAAAAVAPVVLNSGGYQQDSWGNSTALSRLSLGNVALDPDGADDVEVQAGLDLVVVLATVALMVTLNQRNWAAEITTDERNATAADYGLILDGVPADATSQDVFRFAAQFHDMARARDPAAPFEIVEDMTYACRDARELVDARAELALERARAAQYAAWWGADDAAVDDLVDRVARLEDELRQAYCSGTALVVLRHAAHAEAVLDWVGAETGWRAFGGSLVCCGDSELPAFAVGDAADPAADGAADDDAVQVRRAPEPTEIAWRNLGVPLRKRVLGTVASYLISAVAIAAAALAAWQLESWARADPLCGGLPDDCPDYSCGDDNRGRLVVVALATSALNGALRTLVTWATDYELARSRTDREVSLLRKLSVAYVFNTVLVYWFVVDRGQWYVASGLAELATLIAGANAVTQPLMVVCRPSFYAWRYLAACRATTQADLDAAYAPWDFDLAEAYAVVIRTLAIALLFGQIAPLIYPVTAVALLLLYWSLKAALAWHSRHPPAFTAAARDTFRSVVTMLLIGHVVVSAVVYRDDACDPRFRAECGGGGRSCGSQSAGLIWVGAGAVLLVYLVVPQSLYPAVFRPAVVDCPQHPFPQPGLETRHRELQDGPGSWTYRLPK